jgi:hypothetical protein
MKQFLLRLAFIPCAIISLVLWIPVWIFFGYNTIEATICYFDQKIKS